MYGDRHTICRPEWLFFRAFKSVCRAFGRARAPGVSQHEKLSATVDNFARSQQIVPICCLCALACLPLSALHPLTGDKDFLCQYYPECT